jgi:hypothetical protein
MLPDDYKHWPAQFNAKAVEKIRREEIVNVPAKLTPVDAQGILAAWNYSQQRKIRQSTLTLYEHQMQSDQWQEYSEIIVKILPDGSAQLINGYHRLIALSHLDPDTGFRLPVTLSFRYAENSKDVANAYGVIDLHARRNQADAIHAQGIADAWGVTFETAKACGTAGGLILSDFSGGRSNTLLGVAGRSVPGRMEFLYAWEDEVKMADLLIRTAANGANRKPFYRQAVMAVMLVTLRHTPNRATDFWERVITGAGLEPNTPELVLRNYLNGTPMRGTPEHVYARYVAGCWNAYYRGDKLAKHGGVKKAGINEPIVIEGSVYSRGRREKAIRQRKEEQQARMAKARSVRIDRKTGQPEASESLEPFQQMPLPEITDY